MQNEVFEQKHYLSLDETLSYDKIQEIVDSSVTSNLYSYFVGRKEDVIVIKTVISAVPEYNTLNKQESIEYINEKITDYIATLSQNKCVCFGQPPIDLIVELYQPMIQKMATRLQTHWKQFEFDDLVAIGNKVMVELYQKGYYLNKSLIWTTFNNEILVKCRKLKYQPIIVSIYDKTNSDIKVDSEELTYGDMIEDESYVEEKEREDEQQLEKYVFEQVKSIIIEKIGERQWDRLWRDYGKGHAEVNSRATMRRLKAYFDELGLTRQDFINGYRR